MQQMPPSPADIRDGLERRKIITRKNSSDLRLGLPLQNSLNTALWNPKGARFNLFQSASA
jgi:hypothetical protein